ncbi:MAG: metal ABC transporter solute-binding protein, Zn/Mn family [Smithellaceae bacterium]
MKNLFLITLTACLLLLGSLSVFAACDKIDITVSLPPQAYFVEKIAGDLASVHVMIPGGANPATYEPTPQQLVKLSNSRIYVKVGSPAFQFENKYLRIFLDRNPRMTVIDTSAGVKLRTGDPHIWTSPATVRIAARNIAKALSLYDPSHKKKYENNLMIFLAEIDKLDSGIRESLQGKTGYSFMIYHPAWGYFADEYHIIQIPIEDKGKPGNAAHIRKMIDLARQKGISDILVQKGFDAKNARTIAEELGGKAVEVDPLERNWPQGLKAFTGKLQDILRK